MPIQIPGMFENYPEMLRNSPNLYNQQIATWLDNMNEMQQAAIAASLARQQATTQASPAVNQDLLANLAALGQSVPVAPQQEQAPGFWSQVYNRAIDPVQGSLYGMVGLFGDLIGNDTIRDWGIEGYQRNLQEEEEGKQIAPRQVPTIEDIGSLSDAGTWFMETLADQVPNLAATIGSAGIGALAGRAAMSTLGRAAAQRLANQEMRDMAANAMAAGVAKSAAERAAMAQIPRTLGTRWGANAGLYGSLAGIESGSAYGTDVERHGVDNTSPWADLSVGAINSVIERALGMEGSILRNLVGHPVKAATEQAARGILARGMSKLLTSATKEGAAEALQETTQMLNEKIQDDELGSFTPEDTSRLLNSFAAGAALGGPMGLFDSGASRSRGAYNSDIDQYKEQVFNPLYDEVNKIPTDISAQGPAPELNTNTQNPAAFDTNVDNNFLNTWNIPTPFDTVDNNFLNTWNIPAPFNTSVDNDFLNTWNIVNKPAPFDTNVDNDFLNTWNVADKPTPFDTNVDNDFLNTWKNNPAPFNTSIDNDFLLSNWDKDLTNQAKTAQGFFDETEKSIINKYKSPIAQSQRDINKLQSSIAKLQATSSLKLGITDNQKAFRIREAQRALTKYSAQLTALKEQQKAELDKLNSQREINNRRLAKNVLTSAEQLRQQPITENPYEYQELMNIRKDTGVYFQRASERIRKSLDTINDRLINLQQSMWSRDTASSGTTRRIANGLTPKRVQEIRKEIQALRKSRVQLTGALRKLSNVSSRILSKTSDPRKLYTSLADAKADFETLRDAGGIEDVTSIASNVNAPIIDEAAKQQVEQENQIRKEIEAQRREAERLRKQQEPNNKSSESKEDTASKEKKPTPQARGKYPDEETVITQSNLSQLPIVEGEFDLATAVDANPNVQPNESPVANQIPSTRQQWSPTGNVSSLIQGQEQTPTTVEEIANAREDLANTPQKSRILPTDNDVVVKRKIVEQLKNAGRGKKAADEAQILMQMLKSLQSITGETPAQIMQRLNFSLNMPVSEQIKKSLEQTAWHGTPFEGKIDKLSTDYLGSGEGAQVHGWGLYVALDEYTARHYQALHSSDTEDYLRINGHILNIGFQETPTGKSIFILNFDDDITPVTNDTLSKLNINYSVDELIDTLSFISKSFVIYRHKKNFLSEIQIQIENLHRRIKSNAKDNAYIKKEIKKAKKAISALAKENIVSPAMDSILKQLNKELEINARQISTYTEKIKKYKLYKNVITDLMTNNSSGQRMRVEIPEDNVMLREDTYVYDQSTLVADAYNDIRSYIADEYDIQIPARISGRTLYDTLKKILGGPKAASMLLSQHGIKGIRYNGRQDGECAVIFDGNDIDIVEHFYDQQGRGRIDFLQDGTANIIFKDSADASTAIHEFEHFFMNEAGRILNDSTIPDSPAKQQLAQDIQRLGEFAGESPGAASNPHNWSTEAHEKVSKSFELYFRTGKAPEGAGLEALFKRMKDLLVQLYQKATSILGIRNLPKDIRQVFDKQLVGYKKELANTPQKAPEMASTASKQENTSNIPSGRALSRQELVARLLESRNKPVDAGPVNQDIYNSISKAKDSLVKSFKALQDRVNITWAPPVEHKNDLGFIDTNNKITLIASNIEKYSKRTGKSIADITKQVIKHEGLGHYGLRTVLDNRELSKFLNDVYDNLSGTQSWKLFEESQEDFSELSPQQQAEEFCAALAEQMEATPKAPALVKSAWTKLKSLVKPLLDGLGISSIGKPFTLNKKGGKLSQQDIINILKAGANRLSNVDTQAMSTPQVDMSKRMPIDPEATRLDLAIAEANRTLLGRGIDALHDKELRRDFAEGFIERFVDSLRPVQQMIRRLKRDGGNITYETNIYKKLQALPNRTAAHLTQHKVKYVDPLIQAIIETGQPGEKAEITFARFSDYSEAKAGLERNQFREKQPGWNPKESPISGNTNDHWEKIIKKYKSPEMDRAVAKMQELNHARVELMRSENLLPSDMLDNWETAYQYYMPFKSWENVLQEAAPEWYRGDTRRSLSTPNIQRKLGRRALGREGMAENPVVHAVMQLYDVVYLADKVNAGRDLLKLVDDNPDATDIFEKVIFREPGKEALKEWPGLKRVIDKKTGEISYVKTKSTAEGRMSDTVAILDRDGNIQRILFKDSDVLRALKGENIIQASPLIKWIGNLTRTLGKYITSRNPLFWLRNPLRDTITAAINMRAVAHELESMGTVNANEVARAIITKGLMNAFRKNSVRGALQHYYRTGDSNFDKFDAETRAYMSNFKDFLEYGGQTEYFGTNIYDSIKKDLTDALATNNPQTRLERGKAIVEKYGRLMDSFSDALENQTRYIAFNEIVNGITANAERLSNGVYRRADGSTITEQEIKERAANIALNLTVNFSRKGSWAPVFNSLYMFASASIGGNVRMLETIFAKNPKTGKMDTSNIIRFSAYPIAGYLLQTLIARALMPDDEDGINKYDKIPGYIKEGNLIIPSPMFDGSYITLPLPYGFNIFWTMARGIVDSSISSLTGAPGPSFAGAMTSTIGSAFDNFTAIGQTSEGLNLFIPSLFRPLYQLSVNKNFAGNPIKPEGNSYARGDVPESQKYWSTTNQTVKDLCKWLNEAFFGSEVESGYIDVSPETLEHLANSYLGGLGRIFFGMMGRMDDIIRGRGLDIGKLPGTNIFYHTAQDSDTSAIFSKLRTETLNRITVVDNARKSPTLTPQEKSAIIQDNRNGYRLKPILNKIQDGLNKLRQQERLIDRSNLSISEKTKRLEQLRQKKTTLMMRFNKAAIRAGITEVE